MSIDYSPFLSTDKDGHIWWSLDEAIKLVAGYVPERSGDGEQASLLVAPDDKVRANEEIIAEAFRDDRFPHLRPKVLERDGGRFVEAEEFLGWLCQWICQTQATAPFPDDLLRAVRNARRAISQEFVAPGFESLTVALEGWFDQPLSELPDALRWCPVTWCKFGVRIGPCGGHRGSR
jgi:hypothetical protein